MKGMSSLSSMKHNKLKQNICEPRKMSLRSWELRDSELYWAKNVRTCFKNISLSQINIDTILVIKLQKSQLSNNITVKGGHVALLVLDLIQPCYILDHHKGSIKGILKSSPPLKTITQGKSSFMVDKPDRHHLCQVTNCHQSQDKGKLDRTQHEEYSSLR